MSNEFRKTIFFVIGIWLILFAVLAFVINIFDEQNELESRAEFICWSNGYLNGVSSFGKTEYGTYEFICGEGGISAVYYIETNRGYITGGE